LIPNLWKNFAEIFDPSSSDKPLQPVLAHSGDGMFVENNTSKLEKNFYLIKYKENGTK